MKKLEKLKQIIYKYRHAWVLLYGFIYMPWFLYLERRPDIHYYIIHSPLDDYIPFIEYFIIPYFLWFVFILAVVGYFFFTSRRDFYRFAAFLFTGMTLFLIICTVFPNGLHLRPQTFARDNIFTDLVRMLYRTDTPTNVLPSIHVFNSIGAAAAVAHSHSLKKYKKVQYASYGLSFLIILSTMFLKQHSVTDVIAAFAMACIIYPFVYSTETKKAVTIHGLAVTVHSVHSNIRKSI